MAFVLLESLIYIFQISCHNACIINLVYAQHIYVLCVFCFCCFSFPQ